MIECKNLCKTFKVVVKEPGLGAAMRDFFHRKYRTIQAVNDFSMSVNQGEIIGLLGPNGAGKTTIMKMLTGIIIPSSGEGIVLGYKPSDRKVDFRRKISLVMGQKSQLWWDIPAMDSFHLLKSYYEISTPSFNERMAELSELLGVKHLLNVHVRRLSLGERMKMELMACLLHQPEVIFLDEPTIGLDVVAQLSIRDFIKQYHKRYGCTVVLTSHYMADVEALCPRVVLILEGKKRFDGQLNDFAKLLGKQKVITLLFSQSVDPLHPIWRELPTKWSQENRLVEVEIEQQNLNKFLSQAMQQLPIEDINTEKLAIERVMRTLLTSPELL